MYPSEPFITVDEVLYLAKSVTEVQPSTYIDVVKCVAAFWEHLDSRIEIACDHLCGTIPLSRHLIAKYGQHATDTMTKMTMAHLQHDDDFSTVAQWAFNSDVEAKPRASKLVVAVQHNIRQARKIRQAPQLARRTHRALDHSAEPVPARFFRLLDDDISAIGAWHLKDSLPSPGLGVDRQGPARAYWGIAIWSQALQDPLLFKCLALLTLHKKRALAGSWDRVSYLKHKQDAYQLLQTQLRGEKAGVGSSAPQQPSSLASSRSNSVVLLAPVVCLIGYIEVLEGRFKEAAMHIQSVAALGDVAALDSTQWAFVAWNDLRYAMKMATPPVLPGSLPAAYLVQANTTYIDATSGSESRRCALANWKHAQTLLGLSAADALFEILQGVHSLSHLLPNPLVPFDAKLAKLYQVEYKLHTLAADAAIHGAVCGGARATLFIVALQLHLLALASSHAPSTPECRDFLLARACEATQHLQPNDGADRKSQSDASLVWALFVLATHSRRHVRRHRDDADSDVFIPALARLAAVRDLRSRTAFLKLL
jgi:hypothetical protein